MASILIVDDHQIYLDGLEMILQQHLPNTIIHKAHDRASAMEVITQHHMDLILLDLNLNQEDGLEIWRDLKKHFGPLPVAILSASCKTQDIKKSKDNGALGFINKATDNQTLINGIESILHGELYYPYSLPSTPSIHLTPRQQEVLKLLAQGLPNKIICRQLDMSEATVKTHLRALFSVLEVNTRTQCVSVANKYELI